MKKPRLSRFFSLSCRKGRWWLVTPRGKLFFSVGLNHIDSAPLRYEKSAHIWREKYGNSMERWLKEAVAVDLKEWGFNTAGWTQEVVIRGDTIHRHSPPFAFEEYQWLGMPYCHMLPFSRIHQWEAETRHPDFFHKDFEDWCDYVARTHCGRMAGDPKLIGYFYSDCPLWAHTWPKNSWKGPLFDPKRLKSAAGRKELFALASRYYRVTHDAVRRYDPHHLILGDRYEEHAPLPDEVLAGAAPFVDVFSFQHFGKPVEIQRDLRRWHKQTGKPVLLADSAYSAPDKPDGILRHSGVGYGELMGRMQETAGCVGFHLCGGYLRNNARKRGLRDEMERPEMEGLAGIRRVNRGVGKWIRGEGRTT